MLNDMLETKPLDVHLSVEVNNDDVIADVIFSNNGSSVILLDSWTICEDSVVRSNVFNIVDENNSHALYHGMIVNRKVLPDDFVTLNPGMSMQTKINLNKDYEFTRLHKYFIRFCAYNPAFLDKQPRLELLSNKVEITY